MEAKVNRSLIQLSAARRQALRLRRWWQGGKVARRLGGRAALEVKESAALWWLAVLMIS